VSARRSTAPAARSAPPADLAAFCAQPHPPWPPGWQVHYVAVTDSTQDLARAAAERGAPHGSVWVADWQRAGRGRQGRAWVAPPGTSLLVSVLVRDCRLAPFAQLAASSLALCATLEALGLAPRIKWPNDVLLRDRKVAGVLAERVTGAAPPYTILGIGLNVAYGATREVLPPTATALDWELAAARAPLSAAVPAPSAPDAGLARGPLLAQLLGHLAARLAQPAWAWEAALYRQWLARLWRHRQRVRLALDAKVIEGQVEGAMPDGALLLRDAHGALRRITTGDVLL